MKCDKCQTELEEAVTDGGQRTIWLQPDMNEHTPARCLDVVCAQRDKATAKLAECERKAEAKLRLIDGYIRDRDAVLVKLAECEREREERRCSRTLICGAANHPSYGGKCGHRNEDTPDAAGGKETR